MRRQNLAVTQFSSQFFDPARLSNASGALWSTAVRHITSRLRDLSSVCSLSPSGSWSSSDRIARSWPAASLKSSVLARRPRRLFPQRHRLYGPPGRTQVIGGDLGLRLGPARRDQHGPNVSVDACPVRAQDRPIRRFMKERMAKLEFLGPSGGFDDGVLAESLEIDVELGIIES